MNYSEYILSPNWQKLRAEAFKLANGKCEFCQSSKQLNGHHLQYRNFVDCTTEDVMCLCKSHHDQWHSKHSSSTIATRDEVLAFLANRQRSKQARKARPRSRKKTVDFIVVTDNHLRLGMSRKGGWNRTQLEAIGVNWPPPNGWKESMIGQQLPAKALRSFLKTKSP